MHNTRPAAQLTQELPNGYGFNLCYVQGGSFSMGSEDEEAYDDEQPVHLVHLPDFYLGEYPVTQALWLAIMGGENPSSFPDLDRPVESVSWYDALVFCNALNLLCGYQPAYFTDVEYSQAFGQAGEVFERPEEDQDYAIYLRPQHCGYRLPSEAEWEYAARGGQHTQGYRYAGGDDLDKVAWYDDNSYGESKAVGLKLPNELGLFDLSGNVWEWCEDQWHDNYEGAPADGSAWVGLEPGTSRVLRGGSWYLNAQICRSSNRNNYHPTYRFHYVGFRVVLFFPPGSWTAHSK